MTISECFAIIFLSYYVAFMQYNSIRFWTVDKGKVIRTEDGKLTIISACHDMTSFVERHKKLRAVILSVWNKQEN